MNKPFLNLPHFNAENRYQFVTFRTYDSVDAIVKKKNNENVKVQIKQFEIDKYLDESSKGSYLNGNVLEFLKLFFHEKDNELYDLTAFCIMPNHVHILFKQKEALKDIMKILKGSSSITINKLLDRNGKFWENGYYDKIVRDEKHYETVYNYIRNNPLKVGLSSDRFFGKYDK